MLHFWNYFLMPLSLSGFQGFLLNKHSMGWRTQKTEPRNRRLTYKVVQITRYGHCVLHQYELQKFCSIIRFLNIIQNSTKPEKERIQHVALCSNKCSHCIGLNYWRLIFPEKRELSPAHFMLPQHTERQKHPHLLIEILAWKSCQRLEYTAWTSCYWTPLRESSAPTYSGSPSMSLQCSKGGSADIDLCSEEGRSSETQANALKISKTHYYLIYYVNFMRSMPKNLLIPSSAILAELVKP